MGAARVGEAVSRGARGPTRVLIALAAALVVFGGTDSATAKPPDRGQGHVQIVSPGDASFAKGRYVRVAIRARKGLSIRGAFVDGHRVPLKRKGKKHLRVGRINRNRLDPGAASLVVHSRSSSGEVIRDSLHFTIAGQRRQGLLRVSLKAPKAGGPLKVKARLSDNDAQLRARLNGRRVHHLFGRHTSRRTGSLSASDGLRFGRNVLRMLAFLPDGSYAEVKPAHQRDPVSPLAGAGRDRAAEVGEGVKLNGRRSLRVQPGEELAYAWRIVQRPPGSSARLRRADSARPGLTPDRIGTYRIRLSVSSQPNTVASAAASAPGTSDTVSFTAQPNVGPIGVPIDTYDTSTGEPAITVGGSRYTEFPQTAGYQVVALERSGAQGGSLQLVAGPGLTNPVAFTVGTERELSGTVQALGGILQPDATFKPDPTKLVIVTATGASSGVDYDSLNQALAFIGGTAVTDISGGFSIVGIPGQDAGQAYQFAQPNASLSFGGIDGFLSKDSTGTTVGSGGWVMAPSEYVPFKLGAGAQKMIIGDCGPDPRKTPYCSELELPPVFDTPGFLYAVLDAHTLEPIGAPVQDAQADDSDGLQSLAEDLAEVAENPDQIVALKTVGQPAPTDGSFWFAVSRSLQKLGGNPQIFNTLNPPSPSGSGVNDYAFIGGVAVEAQEVWGQAGGQDGAPEVGKLGMSGVLTRDSNWRFRAQLADASAGAIDYVLSQIAYQPPYQSPDVPGQAFRFQGGDYAEAEADIAEQMFCPNGCANPPDDIRSQYWQSDVESWRDFIVALSLTEPTSGASYSGLEFNQLKTWLAVYEWPAVDSVHNMMANLLTPTVAASGEQQADVQSIFDEISQAVKPPSGNVTTEVLEVFAAIGAAASAALAPEFAAPIAAAVIGATAAGFQIASIFTTDDSGNRVLDQLRSTTDDVSVDLAAAVADAPAGLERLRELLVSDWGKLSEASGLFGIVGSGNEAALEVGNHLQLLTARRQAYRSLMPVGLDAKPDPGPNPPDSSILQCVSGMSGTGATTAVEIAQMGLFRSGSSIPESTTLTDPIFAPPTWSNSDLNAGEDPNDFWVAVWPGVGSGPCAAG